MGVAWYRPNVKVCSRPGTESCVPRHHRVAGVSGRHPGTAPAAGLVPGRQEGCDQTFSGFTFQIRSAYSMMVRSLEKTPMPATLMTAFWFQAFWSRYSASTFSWVAT